MDETDNNKDSERERGRERAVEGNNINRDLLFLLFVYTIQQATASKETVFYTNHNRKRCFVIKLETTKKIEIAKKKKDGKGKKEKI